MFIHFSFSISFSKTDAAVANMNFRCSHGGQHLGPWHLQSVTDWGSWDAWRHCDAHQAVCGIQTRVEMNQHDNDDTGLNGVSLLCCDI